MDSDAGGEDDDFGDEVRSDDEEEVGNDDANEGGGTLHQVSHLRTVVLQTVPLLEEHIGLFSSIDYVCLLVRTSVYRTARVSYDVKRYVRYVSVLLVCGALSTNTNSLLPPPHQQDDEDLNDSDDEHLTDDEHHELQKLSRSVNAEGEEEEVRLFSTVSIYVRIDVRGSWC